MDFRLSSTLSAIFFWLFVVIKLQLLIGSHGWCGRLVDSQWPDKIRFLFLFSNHVTQHRKRFPVLENSRLKINLRTAPLTKEWCKKIILIWCRLGKCRPENVEASIKAWLAWIRRGLNSVNPVVLADHDMVKGINSGRSGECLQSALCEPTVGAVNPPEPWDQRLLKPPHMVQIWITHGLMVQWGQILSPNSMVQLESCLQLSAKAVPKAPPTHTPALPVMQKLCKSPRLGDALSVHVQDIRTQTR